MSQATEFFGLSPKALAIIAHIIVESPAGLNFILRPAFTLSSPSPAALPVIRQYGLLLIVVNGLLTLLLLDYCRDTLTFGKLGGILGVGISERDNHVSDQLIGQICGMLSLYHMGPLVRGLSSTARTKAYGGPLVIAIVHGILGAALSGAWLLG